MSEEQNIESHEQNNETEKKCNCKKAALYILILSFIMSLASLSLSIYTLTGGSISAGGEGKKVVISKQFDRGRSLEKAKATNKPILVFFYTDWCGFCQRFIHTFDKITKDKRIKSKFAIAFVNCEKEENQPIMKEYGVQGFPTVFVIDEEGKKTQLDNGTFFNADSKDVVTKRALELIGE